jgi:hypothetical protein
MEFPHHVSEFASRTVFRLGEFVGYFICGMRVRFEYERINFKKIPGQKR